MNMQSRVPPPIRQADLPRNRICRVVGEAVPFHARAVYGVFGTLAIGLGILALFKPALALPSEAYSPLTAHLIREQGAEGVFIGFMAFWCLFHFEARRPVHLALLLFTALFAVIHWAEYLQAGRQLSSPLVSSLPFLVFLATTPFKRSPAETKADARR